MTTGWDKHANKMRMRKRVHGKCSYSTPIDCQEIKFPASESHSSGTIRKCSLQVEDSHESEFHVDHKSLLGCHRDDEDEDECVVEAG